MAENNLNLINTTNFIKTTYKTTFLNKDILTVQASIMMWSAEYILRQSFLYSNQAFSHLQISYHQHLSIKSVIDHYCCQIVSLPAIRYGSERATFCCSYVYFHRMANNGWILVFEVSIEPYCDSTWPPNR